MFTVAVDIGGTFTDVFVLDEETGRTFISKIATTPDDLLVGVMTGLDEAAAQMGLNIEKLLNATERFIHATTQSSNAIFAFTGARTAVLTTRGFGDTLTIMRATGRVAGLSVMERHHYRKTDKPRLLVDERDIFEVSERVDSRGRVVVPLDEEAVHQIVRLVHERGYEALAVAFLFSQKNPGHEKRVGTIVSEEAPELFLSLSSAVAPEIGEYERSATALFNAYVGRIIERYLERLERTLIDSGLRRKLLIVQSNGGLVTPEQTIPVFTIESGPAVGVVGAANLARELAYTVYDAPEGHLEGLFAGTGAEMPNAIGVAGGFPGSSIRVAQVTETDVENRLSSGVHLPGQLGDIEGKLEILCCKHEHSVINSGDVWYHSWQGGGGYGDPLERNPETVAEDVARDAVSLSSAADIYGVVLSGSSEPDLAATHRRREKIR